MSVTHSIGFNTISYAENAAKELDKVLVRESAIGFMADNAMAAKFIGAKTVKFKEINLSGLGDYDRDTGFARGSIHAADGVYTLEQDRGRTFTLDAQDEDESGIQNLSGQILSEFVRTRVAPETEAYALSKIASHAYNMGNTIEPSVNLATPYADLVGAIDSARAITGYNEEMVCFASDKFYRALKSSNEVQRTLEPATFTKGELSFAVNAVEGCPILPIPAERMQTAYAFLTGNGEGYKGGYTFLENATGVYFIVMPKKAVSLVKKTEKLRTFNPGENQTMDAWKFDYRIYYDVFVKNTMKDTIFACLAPKVEIATGAALAGKVLSVAATSEGALEYQWYVADEKGENVKAIVGAKSAEHTLDEVDSKATYFVRIKSNGTTIVDSYVA